MTDDRKRRVIILGATGSIGTQTLDIIRAHPGQFQVVGLSANGSDISALAKFALEFSVQIVAVARGSVAQDLQLAMYAHATALGYAEGKYDLPKILVGPQAASELAGNPCDVVVNGITGSVGLGPTVAALKAGSSLALANKESLVIGGRAVTGLAKPGQIVPVDSEHSALAQCLRSGSNAEVHKLILTASGGPFRNRELSDLAQVNAQDALQHPTWQMGPVVTINSSTMMNKGLEIIEAHLLFDVPLDRIDVVVHPQSIVHSMVEFIDGSTIAQVSPPDMHLPIALGLTWPERIAQSVSPVDWQQASTWTFEPVRHDLFPAISLAKRVGTLAGTAPAVMNGANEVAVAHFLANELPYLEIIALVEQVVEDHLKNGFVSDEMLSIEAVMQAASWSQEHASTLLQSRK